MWFLLSALSGELTANLRRGIEKERILPLVYLVTPNLLRCWKLITWKSHWCNVWGEEDGEPKICRPKIRLIFGPQIETDMYSGAEIHVIKFAKGIDYVSYVCFPQEEAVMALTSKRDVKSDCLTCCASMFEYYILHMFLDYLQRIGFSKAFVNEASSQKQKSVWNVRTRSNGEEKHAYWVTFKNEILREMDYL